MSIILVVHANGDQELVVNGESQLIRPASGRSFCDDLEEIAEEMAAALGFTVQKVVASPPHRTADQAKPLFALPVTYRIRKTSRLH